MCRLLAYASRDDRGLPDLLGPQEWASFKNLSRLHGDGWGMAWLAAGHQERRINVWRSVLPAFRDPEFGAQCRSLGPAGFVHLRWATGGLAVAKENTHPFFAHEWAFAHQGEILSAHRIRALMSPDWRDQARGTTDSELYFLHLLECMQREGDAVAGIRAAVAEILDACGSVSLNAVLLSSSTLIVVYGHAGLESPRDDLLAAVQRPEDIPPDHLDAYFRLRYRLIDGAVIVGSSGLVGRGWADIPTDSIVRVDLHDLSMSMHALDPSQSVTGGEMRSPIIPNH